LKIEILGTGCSKCKKTEKIVEQTVKKLGIQAEIIKVQNLQDIVDRGVMMTPAVAVDGNVKIMGHVPTEEEIQKILQ
jgi:small redox-active disulfide protein 2